MACYRPLDAYRGPGRQIYFDSKKGFADRPLKLPCGQCIGCRLDKSRRWAIRIKHEAQEHSNCTKQSPLAHCFTDSRGRLQHENSFLTLTYDDDHLPPNDSLEVKDWQAFAQRTRKKLGRFRYYHCGEYGENLGRPHLHAICFGLSFYRDRVQTSATTKKGDQTYTSEILSALWPYGFHTIQNVNYEAAQYVARYALKKITGDHAANHYQEVRPEYATMSLKPGIGWTWFNKYKSDVYPSDEVIMNGKPQRPPKYYDSLLEDDELEIIKGKRVRNSKRFEKNNTYERHKVREKVNLARLETYGKRNKIK